MVEIFVGREHNLGQLEEHFQRLLEGYGRVVLVYGEAGIGKTALVTQFRRRIDQHNRHLLVQRSSQPNVQFAAARCTDIVTQGQPYAPFMELLEELVRADQLREESHYTRLLMELAPKLLEGIPYLGPALSKVWELVVGARANGPRTQGDIDRETFKYEFTELLRAMAMENPLVLFVDDLHWSDESSVNLLFHLSQRIQESPILIIGTYRPTDIEAGQDRPAHPFKGVLAEMQRYKACDEIRLGFLNRENVAEFVESRYADNRFPPSLVDWLWNVTEGSPLFLVELLAWLNAEGYIGAIDGVWELLQSVTTIPVPPSLDAIIHKRVGRLHEDLQRVLRYASVEGERFNSGVLCELLTWDHLPTLEKLDVLDRVYQLILHSEEEKRVRLTGTWYQFVHTLVHQAVYIEMSSAIRKELHKRLVAILEEDLGDKVESMAVDLAVHCERAGLVEKAVEYYWLAARQSRKLASNWEVLSNTAQALRLLDKMEQPRADLTRARLLALRGFAAFSLGQWDTGFRDCMAAEQMAGKRGDTAWRIECALRISSIFKTLDRHDEAWEHLLNARELVDAVTDPIYMARVASRMADYSQLAALHESVDDLVRSLRSLYARQRENPYVATKLARALGRWCYARGEPAAAINWFQRSLEAWEEGDQDVWESWRYVRYVDGSWYSERRRSLRALASIYRDTGDWQAAIKANKQITQLAELENDVPAEAGNLNVLAVVYNHMGDYTEAAETIESALSLMQRIQDSYLLAMILSSAVVIYLDSGNLAKAMTAYERFRDLVQEWSIPWMRINLHRYLGAIYLAQGKLPDAQQQLEEGVQLGEELGQEWGVGLCCMYLAEVQLLKGALDQAVKFNERAVEALKRSKAIEEGRALLLMARIFLAREEAQQAERWIQDTRTFYETRNLKLHLWRVEETAKEIEQLKPEKEKARSSP